jgi:hypothetical protein
MSISKYEDAMRTLAMEQNPNAEKLLAQGQDFFKSNVLEIWTLSETAFASLSNIKKGDAENANFRRMKCLASNLSPQKLKRRLGA